MLAVVVEYLNCTLFSLQKRQRVSIHPPTQHDPSRLDNSNHGHSYPSSVANGSGTQHNGALYANQYNNYSIQRYTVSRVVLADDTQDLRRQRLEDPKHFDVEDPDMVDPDTLGPEAMRNNVD